ncbi:MAG: RagB/SusD family nutrient uptake outer membrane protein [Chitinophagaceae bacterium]|nr:RagB/SusD family nutrient uptake outer membrane protein [Chitinophagaceae bacterium]
MKKIILYASLFGAFSLAGCKKYLDKEPDNRTQIRTPEQIAQLLTSAYPQGSYILFTESMSDNAEDKGSGGTGYDFVDRINRQSYLYEVVESSPDDLDGPDFYWNSCYKAIAASNQAMEIIEASINKDQLNPHKGEALVARAYAHFMLVTLFSKAYDPATAATDPGIPYVTAPEKETFALYERKTVAFVYEMIEKDLKEGLPLIDDKIYGTVPKFHFNKKAAAAFAARFYMFKRDYNSVVNYGGQALGGTATESLRNWNTTLTSLQYYELQAEYTKSTERGNLLLQEANSIWGRAYASLRYGLGQNVATDILLSPNVSGWIYAYDLYGATPDVYNIPKFYEHFVRENLNANSGEPYNTVPLFTGEEALLNRAEAYVRLNNPTAAINDMNAFISKNIDDYNPATDNVTQQKIMNYYGLAAAPAMIEAVLDFKRAFFLHEGLRWFDILRLKIPVVHTTRQGQRIELTPDDKRRILQLPPLTKQAGLEPNAR